MIKIHLNFLQEVRLEQPLSIKLGEANALKNNLSDTPIIVLDDILSELDFDRRKTVVNFIREYEQIFLNFTR